MDEDDIKWVPPDQLKSEEPAEDLLESQEMEPYLNLAMAEMGGADMEPELKALRELPLEKRYIWRVASALKWAFADFDTANVRLRYAFRGGSDKSPETHPTPAITVLPFAQGAGWDSRYGQNDG